MSSICIQDIWSILFIHHITIIPPTKEQVIKVKDIRSSFFITGRKNHLISAVSNISIWNIREFLNVSMRMTRQTFSKQYVEFIISSRHLASCSEVVMVCRIMGCTVHLNLFHGWTSTVTSHFPSLKERSCFALMSAIFIERWTHSCLNSTTTAMIQR